MANPGSVEEDINREHQEIEELLRRTFKGPVEAVEKEISKTKDSLVADIKSLRTTLGDLRDRLDAMEEALVAQDDEGEGFSARLVAVEARVGQHQGRRYGLVLALLGLLELGTLAAVLWQGR